MSSDAPRGIRLVASVIDGAREVPAVSLSPSASPAATTSEQPSPPPAAPRGTDGGDPSSWPVTPLGVLGKEFHYLDVIDQMISLKAAEHGRLGIKGVWGHKAHLLRNVWPRYGKRGIDGCDYDAAAEAMMSAAMRCGVWNPLGKARGRGAWLGEEAGELIWHCGDAILIGNEWRKLGLIGSHVYPREQAIPRPWDTPCAGGDRGAATQLLTLLKSWSWKRGALDAHLLLGWIGAAMIAGALLWRPVIWITGGRGTGKSTLQQHLLAPLFDGALIAVSDASAAGVWQKLGHATLPVILDEVEAEDDNRRSQAIVKLARQAASGGLVLRGGADHGASEFTARSCFLFSSILMPPLLGQDRSRLAILELGNLGNAAPPDFDPRRMRDLGRQLMRRLVDGWPRWRETLALYRGALTQAGHGARGADVFGTLLAAADLLLHDGEAHTDYVEELAEQLNVSSLAEAEDDLGDDERCLQHLLTQTIPLDGVGARRPVGEWIARAAGTLPDDDEGPNFLTRDEAKRLLGRYGLKVMEEGTEQLFALASSHAELGKLFTGTHWAGRSGSLGVWTQTLRRLPLARPSGRNLWFVGASAKATVIPLSLVLATPDAADKPRQSVKPRFNFNREDDE